MATLLDHRTPPRQHGCGTSPNSRSAPPRAAPISVNGVTIPHADIARETQNHPAGKPVDAWRAAARALVVRELLLQEARRLGIAAVPAEDEEGRRETDEEAMVRALVEQHVTTPTASFEECRRYYDQNLARFRSADIYEACHILCAADPRDSSARAAARTRAEAAIATLTAAPEQFPALAADISACPSGQTGGSLGQITRGQTVREFEAALAAMQPGELSRSPIETRYGYHVIRLDRHIPGEQVPFGMVQQRIADWLDERVRRTALRQYIANLAGAAQISGIALDTNASEFVQ